MKNDLAAACRFFTPGDAARVALEAYRAACLHLVPPFGGDFMVDGQPFATPPDFLDAFADEVAARLGLLALDRLGEFRPPSGMGDPWEIAALAAPVKMAEIIRRRRDEFTVSCAEILGADSHGLRASDNPRHNASTEGVSKHAGG